HCPYIGQVGTAVIIHSDEAALVELQAYCISVQPIDVGHTADGDDQTIHGKLLFAAFSIRVMNRGTLARSFAFADLCPGFDLQPLLSESLVAFLCDLLTSHCEEVVHCIKDGAF